MSIKFSVPTVVITALLVLAQGAIATAEVYKTSNGQVIVTGLTAKQKYPIKAVNSKNKPVKRQDVAANTCGEALVDGAAKYKSLVIGTETIDPATLTTKVHTRCSPKKTTVAPTKKGAAKPATATKSVMPATAIPTAVPVVTPIGK